MKRVVFIVLCFSFFVATAQKENNIWFGGTRSGLDFNSGSPVPFATNDLSDFNTTNASISNKNGQLLFYTNGYRVFNRNFNVIDSLNIGDYESWGYGFLSLTDAAAIIPFPKDSNKYYLFHVDDNYVSWDTFQNVLIPTHLMYCVVDMRLNGGLGGIVTGQKDLVILSDTLTSCGFKIVKHANGRDYWLICHENLSDKYYRFLIDPFGIHGPYTQQIGYELKGETGMGFSTLVFNNNANMAAQIIWDSTRVQLYDFDRCSGEFYNLTTLNISDTTKSYYVYSGAFSPNGRYFYASANGLKNIWQFDLLAANIQLSRKLIAKYDGALNPFKTNFYGMQLGPDNKIYVHAYDWIYSLHVINYPDSAGIKCGFVENGISVNPPGFTWNGFPNIVNYSLGPVTGSACDSLITVTEFPEPVFTYSVYPNPFSEQINISVTGAATGAEIEMYNLLGQKIFFKQEQPQNYFVHSTINLSSLAPGMYIISIKVNGKELMQKVIKLGSP